MADKVWNPGDVLAAADLNKFGENAHGIYNGTTDGSSDLVVTHGLSWTPGYVFIQQVSGFGGGDVGIPFVTAISSTTFTIKFVAATGSMATFGVTGYWYAAP